MFIGPQIRELINDYLFGYLLKETEKNAWLTFKAVCLNSLGNVQAENYKEIFEGSLKRKPGYRV